MSLRAVTLTQPWAKLVAIGEKPIETRSWRTHYRGPIAIHAAQGLGGLHRPGDPWDPQWKLQQRLIDIIESEPFKTALAPHISGYTPEERADDLERGCILAVATLYDVVPTQSIDFSTLNYTSPQTAERAATLERAFGDFSHGRWAWRFGRILNLNDGIECKGGRGVWTVPADVEEQLLEIWDPRLDGDEDE